MLKRYIQIIRYQIGLQGMLHSKKPIEPSGMSTCMSPGIWGMQGPWPERRLCTCLCTPAALCRRRCPHGMRHPCSAQTLARSVPAGRELVCLDLLHPRLLHKCSHVHILCIVEPSSPESEFASSRETACCPTCSSRCRNRSTACLQQHVSANGRDRKRALPCLHEFADP